MFWASLSDGTSTTPIRAICALVCHIRVYTMPHTIYMHTYIHMCRIASVVISILLMQQTLLSSVLVSKFQGGWQGPPPPKPPSARRRVQLILEMPRICRFDYVEWVAKGYPSECECIMQEKPPLVKFYHRALSILVFPPLVPLFSFVYFWPRQFGTDIGVKLL